jgi:hypothetical protein
MERKIQVDAVELLYSLYRMFKEVYSDDAEKWALDDAILERLADTVVKVFENDKYKNEGVDLRKLDSRSIEIRYRDNVSGIAVEKNPYAWKIDHKILNPVDARKAQFVHVGITNRYYFNWLIYTIIFPGNLIELVPGEDDKNNKLRLDDDYDKEDYEEEKVLYSLI